MGARAQTDTISCKSSNVPAMYKMDGRNIWSMRKLQKIVKDDAEASARIRKGKRIAIISGLLSAASGYIIGNELANAQFLTGRVRPVAIAASAACLGVALPLSFYSRKQTLEGVRTYNRHVKEGLGGNP